MSSTGTAGITYKNKSMYLCIVNDSTKKFRFLLTNAENDCIIKKVFM